VFLFSCRRRKWINMFLEEGLFVLFKKKINDKKKVLSL
jgi:hypothetical protein